MTRRETKRRKRLRLFAAEPFLRLVPAPEPRADSEPDERIRLFRQQPNCASCGKMLALVQMPAGVGDRLACVVERDGKRVLVCEGCRDDG